MEELRINRVHFPVTALGPGTRLGIWFQGCSLACPGCMSRDTWSTTEGFDTTVRDLAQLWRRAVVAGADGLTVSGGEPLEQPGGLAALLSAVTEVRAELTRPGGPAAGRELDVLVYTGYDEEELDADRSAAVAGADVLITGRFDVSAPTRLIWRGSANQRMSPRTDLGRRRYADYLDHAPGRPPMQVASDGSRTWFIGVPRAGTLSGLERALRGADMDIDTVTWRP